MPVSGLEIAAVCVAIGRNAAGFVAGINDLRRRYREAELQVATLTAQANLLAAGAQNLRNLVENPGTNLQQEERDVLLPSVQTTEQLILVFRREVQRTLKCRPQDGIQDENVRLSWYRRVKFMYKQENLNRYANDIAQQTQSMNWFFQTLSG